MSIHDNLVYAQVVDHDAGRLVFHTLYPHADEPEFTDVVFEGVVAYHIEQQAFGGGGANILFDVEEAEAGLILSRYADLLAATKNYGWPVVAYDGLNDLAARLTAGGARCFEVHSSCGMCGFVFAASMEFRRRPLKAQVA